MKSVSLISLYQIESFGLRSIHSYLRKNGADVHLVLFKSWTWRESLQYSKKELALLLHELVAQSPAIVGISVRSLFFKQAINITESIKTVLPDAKIIWGGCHPTIAPEDCIKYCDGLVIGEGEEPVLELLRSQGTPEFYGIKNTWMWRNKEIVKNPVRELNDLDELPVADLTEAGKCYINHDTISYKDPLLASFRRGTYAFVSSRGCPFDCTYCGNRALIAQQSSSPAKFLRRRSVGLVIDELKQAKERFAVKRFFSYDEVFILDRNWLGEFAERYAKEIDLPFHCQVHPSQITEEVIAIFKRLGLQTISMGVQAGNDHTRMNTYNRKTPDSMLIDKAMLLKKHNILAYYDFIFDNPLEEGDRAERDALELLMKFPRPFGLNLYKLQLLPGTELAEMIVAKGLADPNDVQGALTGETAQFDLGGLG